MNDTSALNDVRRSLLDNGICNHLGYRFNGNLDDIRIESPADVAAGGAEFDFLLVAAVFFPNVRRANHRRPDWETYRRFTAKVVKVHVDHRRVLQLQRDKLSFAKLAL